MGDLRHITAELRAEAVELLMRVHRLERSAARGAAELVVAGYAKDVAVDEMRRVAERARTEGTGTRQLCRERARELIDEKAATT